MATEDFERASVIPLTPSGYLPLLPEQKKALKRIDEERKKKQRKQRKMGGGMIKKYSKGGKVDGLAIRGRTRGRMVKGRK